MVTATLDQARDAGTLTDWNGEVQNVDVDVDPTDGSLVIFSETLSAAYDVTTNLADRLGQDFGELRIVRGSFKGIDACRVLSVKVTG